MPFRFFTCGVAERTPPRIRFFLATFVALIALPAAPALAAIRDITFQTICEETGADGLVAFRITGSTASVNALSHDRANQTVNFQMLVYSRARKAVVATQRGGVIVEVRSTNVSTPEILRIAAEASAGEFNELAR